MIYHFSLASVAVVVGLAYVAFHLWAALRPTQFMVLARRMPRHVVVGRMLMGVATVWMVILCATMDLGDFSRMRYGITLFFGALGILSFWLLTDFLAVRALAVLLLLGANVLLDGAFLSDQPAKFLIPGLAYVWIVFGIVLTCSPYLMRDALDWVSSRQPRLPWLAWPGVIFGVVLIVLGATVY